MDLGELGHLLSQARTERGWSRNTLAEQSGVHHRVVTEVESGTRDAKFTTIVKLFAAVGIDRLDMSTEAE